MSSADAGRRPIVVVEAPEHPVEQLQGPFEESMFESQSGQLDEVDVPLDATSRRTMLLEAPTYQRVIAGRWKQKKGERYHPLWKLVAQMSFGIHLLAENMAISEEDVFQILQTHVDDIDIFLERTTEDFTLAQEDIQERLKCLKLPLQHPDVFDRMLEDRAFRNSIVDGNEKIEHIVTRTGCAMKDALKDVQKGFESTSALERYLNDLQIEWTRGTPEHEAVFIAMLGNVEGWKKAFVDLHVQGNKLAGALRKLTDVINQMQQRAGEVSRRLIRQQQRQGGSINGSNSITYISQQSVPSRSSSRQHTTPSPSTAKKPLPTPTSRPSRTSTRQHSRNHSSESAQAQRTGTSQSHRSVTNHSIRSGSRAETPLSRAPSRNDLMITSLREHEPNTSNNTTPRVVYVANHLGHQRTNSQNAPVQQQPIRTQPIPEEPDATEPAKPDRKRPEIPKLQIRRQESNISTLNEDKAAKLIARNFAPVELPAELPPAAFLQIPMSSTNRLSAGLGILPSERRAQAQSKGFNPTTALIELLSDPSRYSRLPLTPNSARSPGAALAALEGQRSIIAQTQQQATMREPTPDQTPPKSNDVGANEKSPSTPAWGSRPVNTVEQGRAMAEKIPLTNDQSEGRCTSPATASSNQYGSKSAQPMLKTALYGSLSRSGSSTPNTETSATEKPPSELSTGNEHEIPMLSRQNSMEAVAVATTAAREAAKKKKLSFIAELEGSQPIFLPSTVYTPLSATMEIPTTYELEAPQMYFSLPPRPAVLGQGSASVSELSGNEDDQPSAKVHTPVSLGKDVDNINIQLEEAIRKTVVVARNSGSDFAALAEGDKTSGDATSDHQKTPKLPPNNRMSAKIESMADMVHQPSFTPPESPLPETRAALTARNSAMLDSRRNTTIHTKTPVSAEAPPIPEEPSSPRLRLEITPATEEKRITTIQSPTNEDTNVESIISFPASPKLTLERPKSPFPLKLNIITKPSDQENKPCPSPTLKTPTTPSSIDLARSNTQDSRKKWKAFFVQRKGPLVGAPKSPASPSLSVQSTTSSPKRSILDSPRSATFGNLGLRPKGSRDDVSSSPSLSLRVGKGDEEKLGRAASPLIKSELHGGVGVDGVDILGEGEANGDGIDHHSIFDDYV